MKEFKYWIPSFHVNFEVYFARVLRYNNMFYAWRMLMHYSNPCGKSNLKSVQLAKNTQWYLEDQTKKPYCYSKNRKVRSLLLGENSSKYLGNWSNLIHILETYKHYILTSKSGPAMWPSTYPNIYPQSTEPFWSYCIYSKLQNYYY